MTSLGGRWSRTTIVLMLLAVIGLMAGWSTKAPCVETYRMPDGQIALDWRDWKQYSEHCYSDVIPLYGLERLQDGDLPYKSSWVDGGDGRTRYMEYPVVTGMLQYGAMRVTKAIVSFQDPTQPHRPEVIVYFGVMAVVLAVSWLVAVACTIPLAARKRDVALMALSPLIAVHAFTNFDTLSVALAAGGMLAWARHRPVAAGILFGLGAAAKLYPVFILGALLVLCLRSNRMPPWWKAFGAAAGAWLAVNLPFALLYPDGWAEFFRLNSARPADHDSIYNAIAHFTGWAGFDGPLYAGVAPHNLNLVTFGLFALVCLGVGLIGLFAPQRPRVASLVFLIVAGFLLTNKVWSPQYSLWLVPLAVLAIPRWIPLLAWMGVDAYLWYPRMEYFLALGSPNPNDNKVATDAFLHIVLVRDLLVLGLCVLVIWTIFVPRHDPVRRDGVDDPAGGPLEGTPLGRPRWRELRPFGSAEPASPEPATPPTGESRAGENQAGENQAAET